MPELAALERVAKELEDWIIQLAGRGPSGKGGTYVPHAGDLAPRLAAALAACAREAELKVARRIQTEVNWAVTVKTPSRVGSVAKWLDEHIAALERAAGEKGRD